MATATGVISTCFARSFCLELRTANQGRPSVGHTAGDVANARGCMSWEGGGVGRKPDRGPVPFRVATGSFAKWGGRRVVSVYLNVWKN